VSEDVNGIRAPLKEERDMGPIAIQPSIDTAWIEAEQQLGEYWRIRSLTDTPKGWEAVATDGKRIVIGRGGTPASAIRALHRVPHKVPK
jgi:hypothetical protein